MTDWLVLLDVTLGKLLVAGKRCLAWTVRNQSSLRLAQGSVHVQSVHSSMYVRAMNSLAYMGTV
jgi:hypothetical protein